MRGWPALESGDSHLRVTAARARNRENAAARLLSDSADGPPSTPRLCPGGPPTAIAVSTSRRRPITVVRSINLGYVYGQPFPVVPVMPLDRDVNVVPDRCDDRPQTDAYGLTTRSGVVSASGHEHAAMTPWSQRTLTFGIVRRRSWRIIGTARTT